MTERIAIGKVLSPHGIKGEVRVYPWSDRPDRFNRLKEIYLTKDQVVKQFRIVSARSHKNLVIMGFAEITSADQAEQLRDWTLEIDKQFLDTLPEGHYYIFELLGLKVKILEGRELGTLSQVIQTGANDVYVVRDKGGKEVLIPALKSVVKTVDLKGREMVIDPLPGLLD